MQGHATQGQEEARHVGPLVDLILKLVVGQGLALAGGGILIGLLVALPVTGAIESLLVGVRPADPVTYGGISLVFATVAAFACYLPARRATRVNPMTALRCE